MERWLLKRLEEGKELEPLHLGALGSHHQHERASNGVGSKGYLKAKDRLRGIWRLSLQDDEKNQAKEAKLTTWTFGAQVPHKVIIAKFHYMHHIASLLLLECLHALHFLVLCMVGCLCLTLTHEQPI